MLGALVFPKSEFASLVYVGWDVKKAPFYGQCSYCELSLGQFYGIGLSFSLKWREDFHKMLHIVHIVYSCYVYVHMDTYLLNAISSEIINDF